MSTLRLMPSGLIRLLFSVLVREVGNGCEFELQLSVYKLFEF